ncbi:MAG: Smr/MutS family protein [SAR324 cluster bacterium]
MPRRRLHGETQKERQKKASRILKLRGSTLRKQDTRTPLPYESSPELDPQDIEFLETMRDLHVRRLPGQGGAPVRQAAFERVHFAADSENDALFHANMQETGVAPLKMQAPPPGNRAQPGAAARQDAADVSDAPLAGPAGSAGKPAPAPAPAARESAAPAANRPGPAAARGDAAGTRFDEGEDGARLMEEALRSGVVSLNEKFQGAVEGTVTRRTAARWAVEQRRASAEPDDELDLHGKTQEEAIRLVRHFLHRAKHRRLRAVLIITGRGLNSGAEGAVLRNAVQSWLERNGAPDVRHFAWAPRRLGGDGAIWVDLW